MILPGCRRLSQCNRAGVERQSAGAQSGAVKTKRSTQGTLTPTRGRFATYFNRGILSTQFLAHAIPPGPSGAPDYKVLTNRIDQPGDPLRSALAGQILDGLELLLRRAAAEGRSCYAALYELTAPELVQLLLDAKNLT